MVIKLTMFPVVALVAGDVFAIDERRFGDQ